MDSACLPNTAGYTFNGGHVGGQAIFESVHAPLTGGGRRRGTTKRSVRSKSTRRSTRKSTRRSTRKSTRRSTRKSARRSTRKSTRRSTKRTTRRNNRKRIQGRRAIYRGRKKWGEPKSK